jgi:uncharacterized integral membrane protein
MRELLARRAIAGHQRISSGYGITVNALHSDRVEAAERNDRARTHRARTAHAVLGVILLVVLVALVADNRSNVRVGWVSGHGELPLAVVLAIAAVAGSVIGWLLLHRPGRRGHRT